MQAHGRDAEFVKHDKKRIPYRHAPRAFLEVMPGGGFNGRIEQGNPARGAEAFREFHIFHERKLCKTAELLEGGAPDENGLIAVKCPAVTR